jgi:hypothetical protein
LLLLALVAVPVSACLPLVELPVPEGDPTDVVCEAGTACLCDGNGPARYTCPAGGCDLVQGERTGPPCEFDCTAGGCTLTSIDDVGSVREVSLVCGDGCDVELTSSVANLVCAGVCHLELTGFTATVNVPDSVERVVCYDADISGGFTQGPSCDFGDGPGAEAANCIRDPFCVLESEPPPSVGIAGGCTPGNCPDGQLCDVDSTICRLPCGDTHCPPNELCGADLTCSDRT